MTLTKPHDYLMQLFGLDSRDIHVHVHGGMARSAVHGNLARSLDTAPQSVKAIILHNTLDWSCYGECSG